MTPRLFFIDDDPAEIEAIEPLVKAQFDFEGRAWPFRKSIQQAVGDAPDIFVLDLYLPPAGKLSPVDMSEEEMTRQREDADRVGRCFSGLYVGDQRGDGKKLLQQTMACLTLGRELLDRQWKVLRQSPQNGIALMKRLRALYAEVPVVFYSRKITPADAVDVMRAGAFDAIQKGTFTAEALCARLKSDVRLFKSSAAQRARKRGQHFNITMLGDPRRAASKGRGRAGSSPDGRSRNRVGRG